MKFLIITHAFHKVKDNSIYAYEPYVREMNLWIKNVDQLKIIAPIIKKSISEIETKYNFPKILLTPIYKYNVLSFFEIIKTVFKIPVILVKIVKEIFWADHIHLRCPGNIGLLGCVVQIFFPSKPKTVKYAGNWDPNSIQPLSYKIQKWIISNTFLTRNCKVLVYGEWENQSKNIIPFFTASYSKSDIKEIGKKPLINKIKLIFVGTFSEGKQPILSVKTVKYLLEKGYDVQLDMYGNGVLFPKVSQYIEQNSLQEYIHLHGNQPKETVKKAFQKAHFLIFISKSEGWPKVVAEAMFWRCLPISTKVSCVPYMLGNGSRGSLVNTNANASDIGIIISNYLKKEETYKSKVLNAQSWSQKYTLDFFEQEIKKLLI